MTAVAQPFDRPLILLGGGGHAKVVLDLIHRLGADVVGICDPKLQAEGLSHWRGHPVLGGDEALERFDPAEVLLAHGIGTLPGQQARRQLFERLTGLGYRFATLVHPRAVVADGVELGQGTQVMAGAIIQADASIGANTIINTSASVDHDCRIGAHVHVAPGATLCGGVVVGDGAHIGSGATAIQGLTIGACALLGAGATLVKPLPAGARFLGRAGRLTPVRGS
jgi:sugar O-acyltransferase (sialic acid O-acetyltransferase NeuD family)